MIEVSTSWLGRGAEAQGKSGETLAHGKMMHATGRHSHNLFSVSHSWSLCKCKSSVHTWNLFLASSRWWISLGQSCITVVSCLSWQSRYFSPASMYSLHSCAWRLVTAALPLPRTRPPAPLAAAPDRGPLRGSADRSSSNRRRVARRRMAAEERRGEERNRRPLGNQVNLGRLCWTQEAGHSCVSEEKNRKKERERWIFKGPQRAVQTNWCTIWPFSWHLCFCRRLIGLDRNPVWQIPL